MADKPLGFIGLGMMGGPISGNLAKAGHALIAFDAAGTRQRAPAGAAIAESTAEVAAKAGTIFLSLPDGKVVERVTEEIAKAPGRAATLVVDLSTIGIQAAREAGARLAAAGITYVDAPVSGGVAGAKKGQLSVMVGATAAVFESLKPYLASISANPFRVGDAPGAGQAMKLVNNFLSCMALTATSEAMAFGLRAGLDLETMTNVLNVSSGRSSATQDKLPRAIIPGTYDFGFATKLANKDVGLYLDNAHAAGAPTALADVMVGLWARFCTQQPDSDFTRIFDFIKAQGSKS